MWAQITEIRSQWQALEDRRRTKEPPLTEEEQSEWSRLYEVGHRLRRRADERGRLHDIALEQIPSVLISATLYPEGPAFVDTPALQRAREYFERDVDDGACLVLSGPTGTGKSWAAAAVVLEQGGEFSFWPQSCARLLTPEHRDDELKRLRCRHVIVLDDFGLEYSKEGGFLEALVDEVIWYREGNECPTIITTNLTPKVMRNTWSARIVDRLRGKWASVYAVPGPSLRSVEDLTSPHSRD